jgi:two-component system response regulator ResD
MKNRILIVDDNEEINQLVLLYLEKHGFIPDQAITFAEAQTLLRRESYDLVILDWNLDQGESGLNLLPFTDRMTKILLFSANSKSELTRARQENHRIDEIMSKDFRGDELLLKIRALLDIY